MNEASLLRAIREPARLYGGEVSLELALRLIQDTAGEADALPLAQHCLMRLWRQAEVVGQAGRRLDLAAYPSLRDSLSHHADEVLAELEQEDRRYLQVAGFLFRALTEFDNEGRAIRRPRTFAELVVETGTELAGLALIIDAFRRSDRSFLIPASEKPLADGDIVDISHEALIRCWKHVNDPTPDREALRMAATGTGGRPHLAWASPSGGDEDGPVPRSRR